MAKGIDIQIERLRSHFEGSLYLTNDCNWYGRIFRNETEAGILPERYISSTEYEDVLLNDKKDLTCFFDVLPEDTYSGRFVTTVWICFAVNLDKLYPTVTTERPTEYIHEDVIKEIKKIGGWQITGLVRGLPAFSDYGSVKNTDDLHPYYLFRINCEVKYPQSC